MLPMVMFPKLRLVGFDPSVPCVTPVPVTGIVKVGLDAVEVMVTSPLALAADVGANLTLKVVLCPAVRVSGVEIPLRLKPVPVMVA